MNKAMHGVSAVLGCCALLVSISNAKAQSAEMGTNGQAQAGQSGGTGGASMADKMFVKKAMTGGIAEVVLGQLAAQKAGSDEVKQFGQKMVDDHTRLNDQMKPIAAELGVAPQDGLSPEDEGLKTRLDALSGDAFDRAYLKAMVKDHRKDLAEFKREASSGKDSQVRSFAEKGAQVVSGHLEMAEQLAGKVGAAGKSGMKKSDTMGAGQR